MADRPTREECAEWVEGPLLDLARDTGDERAESVLDAIASYLSEPEADGGLADRLRAQWNADPTFAGDDAEAKRRAIEAGAAAKAFYDDRVAKLREALEETTDDLEAEIRARYRAENGVDLSRMLPKRFDRDMQLVYRARRVLKEAGVNYYPGVECEHGRDFCPECDHCVNCGEPMGEHTDEGVRLCMKDYTDRAERWVRVSEIRREVVGCLQGMAELSSGENRSVLQRAAVAIEDALARSDIGSEVVASGYALGRNLEIYAEARGTKAQRGLTIMPAEGNGDVAVLVIRAPEEE